MEAGYAGGARLGNVERGAAVISCGPVGPSDAPLVAAGFTGMSGPAATAVADKHAMMASSESAES